MTVAVTTSPVFSQPPCAPSADASTADVAAGAEVSTVTVRTAVSTALPASSLTTALKLQAPLAKPLCGALTSCQAAPSLDARKVTVLPGSWPDSARLKVLSRLSPSLSESPRSWKFASTSVPAVGGVVSTR